MPSYQVATNWASLVDRIVGISSQHKYAIVKSQFYNNSDIAEIPSQYSMVSAVGNDAFNRCTSLLTANIPECEFIGHTAFTSCSKLESVYAPNVRIVGNMAFLNCSKLSEIHIPPTVEKITGKAVFKGCKELTIYAPAGSVAEAYAKANKIPFIAE